MSNPSRAGTSVAGEHAYWIAKRARAYSVSSSTSASSVAMISSRRGRSSSVSSRRMRSTSSNSSDSSSRMRLPNSTAAGGSTNSVAPDAEVSCTMPPASDARSASHGNHVPAVAHRDRHVRHAMMRLEAAHLAFENSNQLFLRRPQLAPNAAQRGGRVVLDAAVLENGLFDARSRAAAPRSATSSNGASTARTIAGRLGSRSDACVRRDVRSSVAAAASSRPLQMLPITRSRASGAVRSGVGSGSPGFVAGDGRAHGGDAPVLAVEDAIRRSWARARECAPRPGRTWQSRRPPRARAETRERTARANSSLCLSLRMRRRRTPQDGRDVRAANSSRTMALMVPPSARPLNWDMTLPITAPTFAAPPSIAATTAARISSSLTPAGR